MGRRAVPERWEEYSHIGQQVQGTRFVAFKVPLKHNLLAQVSKLARGVIMML